MHLRTKQAFSEGALKIYFVCVCVYMYVRGMSECVNTCVCVCWLVHVEAEVNSSYLPLLLYTLIFETEPSA